MRIIKPVFFKFQTAFLFKLTTQSLPSPGILSHIQIKSQPSNFSSPLYIKLLVDPHSSRSSSIALVSIVISCPDNALALPLLTVCAPSFLPLLIFSVLFSVILLFSTSYSDSSVVILSLFFAFCCCFCREIDRSSRCTRSGRDIDMGQIQYSEKYFDDTYEYRHVVLPPEVAKLLPKNRLLSENEWRAIGVQQSRGWVHYAIHRPEPHIMLFRRPLNYQQQQVNHAAAVQTAQMLAK
ncbi:Cyclin-dependent kinases regulatory subunit [Musa troglodytarum]|uniref:Cyclin-dependent kinases regulatory subunit n=1 Tax=Musa troglodytarum TaxID=320322 RepID=A0A9E7FPE7_9LILI|nr:Cyclin-dependent kinases regulatory subunit [Musa troglodytarum]